MNKSNLERDKFSNKIDFILTCVDSAVLRLGWETSGFFLIGLVSTAVQHF